MKPELLELLASVVAILRESGWADEANWFEKRGSTVKTHEIGSDECRKAIKEVDAMLAGGMGSFLDIPLSSVRSGRSASEMREVQWQLAEQLGNVINRIQSEYDQGGASCTKASPH